MKLHGTFRILRPRELRIGASCVLICTAFWMHGSAASGQDRQPMLLVANQGDADISLVDLRTQKQVAAIVEGIPKMVAHEMATSPDGKLAYVPLYGDSGVGKPGSDGRLMLVIDLATRKIVDQVDFGHGVRPHCVVYDRTSNLLYVTTELDKSVTIVDPRTLKVVGAVSTNQDQSHMLTISHDGRRGYTANVGPGTVSVLDLKARKFVTTISIAATTQRISISNDDSMVFTSDQAAPRMAVIDTETNKIRQWVDLPAPGYGSASSIDGSQLLMTFANCRRSGGDRSEDDEGDAHDQNWREAARGSGAAGWQGCVRLLLWRTSGCRRRHG